ncbi:MAG: HAMP domain-containing histidine kinase [Chloroflexi bacterium]|nr:HAMP domain-containing histidine kinase [Chloroflexota bacterium]
MPDRNHHHRDWPIRWQLSAFYAGLLVMILGVLGLALYLQLQQFLITDAEDRLSRQVKLALRRTLPDLEGVRQKIGGAAFAKYLDSGDALRKIGATTLVSEFNARDSHVAIYNLAGELVLEGNRAPDVPAWPVPSADQLKSGTSSIGVVASGQRRVVLLVIPFPFGNQVIGTLAMSASLEGPDAILAAFRLYLALGMALAALVGITAGAWLTRRTLRPLDQVASTAAAIAAGDLSRRVGMAGRHNEIGKVAAAFDAMVAQLEAALRTQRRFVADASHELRTPLTALNGMTEMLLLSADQGDPAARQRLLRQIRAELARLTRLVAELLELSRLDTAPQTQCVDVDLTALACDMVVAARVAHPDRVLHEPEGTAVIVSGDADRLRQVMLNLIDNALKYTQPGGHVCVSVTAQAGWAELSVSDNGEGIAPEALPHIFDRFYRADKSRARTPVNT